MKSRLSRLIEHIGPIEVGLLFVAVILLINVLVASVNGTLVDSDLWVECIGMIGLGLGFTILHRLLLWGSKIGSGVMGVATTVIHEAMNIKLLGMMIVILTVILPWLAVNVAEGDALLHRVQTYLDYSIALIAIVLSLMTVTLGCRTISAELEDKQIYIVSVKPLSRPMYILGKWIGIMMLNIVLLVVSMTGVYLLTTQYLAEQKGLDSSDKKSIADSVLTSRVSVKPQPVMALTEQVKRVIDEKVKREPENIISLGRIEALEKGYGDIEGNRDLLMRLGRERLKGIVETQIGDNWMSIGRNSYKTYVFTGLEKAKTITNEDDKVVLQLRYKLSNSKALPTKEVTILLKIRDSFTPFHTTLGQYQTLTLQMDPRFIDDQGRFELTVINQHPQGPQFTQPGTLMFSAVDGMEMLYQVDRFESNFTQGIILMLLKLGFLAMMSLTMATFLGFPVALLAAMLICMAASFSDFFLSASTDVQRLAEDQRGVNVQIQGVLGLIGEMVSRVLLKYSEFKVVTPLVEGRFIGWGKVMLCFAWIGVVWTGLCAAAGMWIFKTRELARVQI